MTLQFDDVTVKTIYRLSHKLLGNFSAAFEILGTFCDFRQLLKLLASFGLNYFLLFLRHLLAIEKKGQLNSTGLYYWVSVWTPGLAQLPMPAWCCAPVHEVSGITWSIFQNGGQQCLAGKNVQMKGRSIQLLNLSSINQWSFVKKEKKEKENTNKTNFKRKKIITIITIIIIIIIIIITYVGSFLVIHRQSCG